MNNKKNKINKLLNHTIVKNEIPSIISQTCQFEGNIKSSKSLEIEGNVKGNIEGNCVIIRQSGNIDGDVKASKIDIYGKFTGNLKSEIINIFEKAYVNATIEYDQLSVKDGASIDGQFKKIKNS